MKARPTIEEAVLALAGIGWVTALLWSRPVAAGMIGVVSGCALLVSRRHPVTAAAVVLAGCLLAAALGVPSENPALLLPVAVVVYGLGRWSGRTPVVLALLGLLASLAWADALSLSTLIFGTVLYGCFWGFGRLVAAKTRRASAARRRAATVGSQDPLAVAGAVVAEERARLASEIAGMVGETIRAMLADAASAGPELDAAAIERIRVRGTGAITELRQMLGLLRHPQSEARPSAQPGTPGPGWSWYVVAPILATLGLVELLTLDPGPSVAVFVLLTLVPLSVALRRRALMTALLLSAGALALAVSIGPTRLGIAVPVALAILSWSAGVEGRRPVWLGWLLMVLAGVLLVLLADPDNAAMLAVVTVLPAWAGHAWSEEDREQRSAQHSTAQAQSVLDRAVADAVRNERLRVARDLHDVTSHALGVMVLQAGAVSAQRVADPARARASLAVIADTGRRALDDLDRLIGLIDQGVLGVAVAQEATDLPGRLVALAERIRQAGVRVVLRIERPPADPAVAQVCYRVVQEALTNAVRHASGSSVRVVVEGSPGECSVVVRDDGRAAAAPAAGDGSGLGLIGAAERVRAVGGEFHAGPDAGAGWAVRVRLPSAAAVVGDGISTTGVDR